MAKRDQEQRSLTRLAVRRRAELGVIATYILELASTDRRGRGRPRRRPGVGLPDPAGA
jgi:hypothetical protein